MKRCSTAGRNVVRLAVFTLWFVCGATGRGQAQAYLFPNAQFAAGAAPNSVVAGDLNGDGISDLVTVNTSSNTVSVLIGNGSGGFGPKTDYAVGSVPFAVALGDVNGDGKLDIVVGNDGGPPDYIGTVSVLLGNGSGGFAAKTDYVTQSSARAVALGDMNGDGRLDLISANYDGSVSIFLNSSSGFGVRKDYGVDNIPSAIVLADLNGDGKLDIVTSSYLNGRLGTASVLLGDGSGGVGPKTLYNISPDVYSFALGDINGDGKLDLVAVDSRTLILMPGNGMGGFGTPTVSFSDFYPSAVALKDMNGDGRLDIVTSSGSTVRVLLGNGSGGFSSKDYPVGNNASAIVLTDANGDGKPDIITSNKYGNTVSVLFNDGVGGFKPKTTEYAVGSVPRFVALKDLNGDGKLDIVTANVGTYNYSTGLYENRSLSVLLGNSMGGFDARTDYPLDYSPDQVAVGDINGDGKLDVAIANPAANAVSVLLNDGAGGFAATANYTVGTNPNRVALGDLNGDGKLDIVTVNSSGGLSVLLNDGLGGGSSTDYPLKSYPNSVILGDVNGDGKLDLIAVNSAISILLNDGSGGFGAISTYNLSYRATMVAAGDLNGDGKLDLVQLNSDIGTGYSVSVLLGNGSGGFTATATYALGSSVTSISLGDVDGDGKLDILLTSSGSTVSLLRGDGSGGFGAISSYLASGTSSLTSGDVNGDGKPDLVAVSGGNKVSILLQNPVPVASAFGMLTLYGISANAPVQDAVFTFRPTAGGTETALPGKIAANGSFATGFLPAVPGTLHVKGSKYLALNFSVDLSGGDVTGITGTLPAGDADNNNVVNLGDFGLLINAYGSAASDGSGYYDSRADFNGDGRVDLGDFGLLINSYGEAGEM